MGEHPQGDSRIRDSPATKVPFDHHAYPTVLDCILQNAPWSVLSAFRATSKAFYARVNAIQGEHVILSTYNSPTMKVLSPGGRVPGLQHRHYTDWAQPGKKTMKASLERAKVILGKTRVVDLVGIGDLCLVPISKALLSVKTLRIRMDEQGCAVYRSAVKADTLVIFGHVGMPRTVNWSPHTVAEGWVKKLVVNVTYHHSEDQVHVFPVVWEPGEPCVLEHVVYIFTKCLPEGESVTEADAVRGSSTSGFVSPVNQERDRWLHLRQALASMFTQSRSPTLKATIVDLDSVDPRVFGFKTGQVLQDQLLDDTLPRMESVLDRPDALDALSRIEFLTAAEYASRLSPGDYMLETVEAVGP